MADTKEAAGYFNIGKTTDNKNLNNVRGDDQRAKDIVALIRKNGDQFMNADGDH